MNSLAYKVNMHNIPLLVVPGQYTSRSVGSKVMINWHMKIRALLFTGEMYPRQGRFRELSYCFGYPKMKDP